MCIILAGVIKEDATSVTDCCFNMVVFFLFQRIVEPPEVRHERLFVVSVLGFIVNLIGIFAFQHGGHGHSHGGKDNLTLSCFAKYTISTILHIKYN